MWKVFSTPRSWPRGGEWGEREESHEPLPSGVSNGLQRVGLKGRSAGVLAAQTQRTARRDALANPPARTPVLLVHSRRSILHIYALGHSTDSGNWLVRALGVWYKRFPARSVLV